VCAAAMAVAACLSVRGTPVDEHVLDCIASIWCEGQCVGSGALISANGLVLTNEHVVSGCRDLRVRLRSGEIHRASIVGVAFEPSQEGVDAALLQVEDFDLPYLEIADSDLLLRMQSVIVAGFPEPSELGCNRDATLTTGGLNAMAVPKRISIRREGMPSSGVFKGLMQIDATVKPGSSGSPVLDEDGRVVGLLIGGSDDSAFYFATPINAVVEALVDAGILDPCDLPPYEPTVKSIAFPSEIVADGQQVKGSIRFRDLNADLMVVDIVPTGSGGVAIQETEIYLRRHPEAYGRIEADVPFFVSVSEPQSVSLKIVLTDSYGNRSEPRLHRFTARDPFSSPALTSVNPPSIVRADGKGYPGVAAFADPDGDVVRACFEVIEGDFEPFAINLREPLDGQPAYGRETGEFDFSLSATTPGHVELSLTLIDEQGRRSDACSLAFDVVEVQGAVASVGGPETVLFEQTRLWLRPEDGKAEYAIEEEAWFGASIAAGLFRDNGYVVDALVDAPIGASDLATCSVLLVPEPAGDIDYLPSEVEAIRRFVEKGGGLLCTGRHWRGGATRSNVIAQEFGVSFASDGFMINEERHSNANDFARIHIQGEHPILRGVTDLWFSGPYIEEVGASEVVAASGDDSWFDRFGEEDWGDRVQQPDEDSGPFPILSLMEYGAGRAAFFADASFLLNGWVAELDAERLATNIIDWLAFKIDLPPAIRSIEFAESTDGLYVPATIRFYDPDGDIAFLRFEYLSRSAAEPGAGSVTLDLRDPITSLIAAGVDVSSWEGEEVPDLGVFGETEGQFEFDFALEEGATAMLLVTLVDANGRESEPYELVYDPAVESAAEGHSLLVLVDETRPHVRPDGSVEYGVEDTGTFGLYGVSLFLALVDYRMGSLHDVPIAPGDLDACDVLLLLNPSSDAAYAPSEIDAIVEFVEAGGGLFVSCREWMGSEFGGAADGVARAFGASFKNNGEICGQVGYSEEMVDVSRVDITSEHPLLDGISSFWCQGTFLDDAGPSEVLAFTASDTWFDAYSPDSWGDGVQQTSEETGPFPVLSVLEYGEGRVVFGDASVFMNGWFDQLDALYLVWNIVRWLGGTL